MKNYKFKPRPLKEFLPCVGCGRLFPRDETVIIYVTQQTRKCNECMKTHKYKEK